MEWVEVAQNAIKCLVGKKLELREGRKVEKKLKSFQKVTEQLVENLSCNKPLPHKRHMAAFLCSNYQLVPSVSGRIRS